MDLESLSFNVIYFKSINHYATNIKFKGQRIGLAYKHDGETLTTYQMYDEFGYKLLADLNRALSNKDNVSNLNYQAFTRYMESKIN